MMGLKHIFIFLLLLLAAFPDVNAQRRKKKVRKSKTPVVKIDYAEQHYQDAIKNASVRNYADAVQYFNRSMDLNYKDPEKIFYNRGISYLELKQFDKAYADFSSLTVKRAVFDKVEYYKALCKLGLKDTNAAINHLQNEIIYYPQSYEPYYYLGVIYFSRGQGEEANKYFRIAKQKNTDYVYAYQGQSSAFYNANRLDSAEFYINKALKMRPENADFVYNKAVILSQTDPSEASRLFQKVVQMDTSNIIYKNSYALFLYNVGEYRKAVVIFNQVLRMDPSNSIALFNRAATYIKTSEFEKALLDLNAYIKLKPEVGIAYLNRGIVYENLFRLNEACADWKKAAELGVEKAEMYYKKQCVGK